MTDRTAILATFFFGPLVLASINFCLPYTFPFTSPQRATLEGNSSIDVNIFIDGQMQSFSWEVNAGSPRPFFGGIENFGIVGSNHEYEVYIKIPLSSDQNRPILSSIHLSESDSRNQYLPVEIELGTIHIRKSNQSLRHLTFEGSFSQPEIIMKHKKQSWDKEISAPRKMEIKSGEISIDAKIIYEWSSKGGETYRL